MTTVERECPLCRGSGVSTGPRSLWPLCASCGGIGRTWLPDAPDFGCRTTLADRDPGEVVTLGNGDQGKILWHMPRKTKKVRPHTTFLGLFGEFDGSESHNPVAYPSCVGVASVDVSRTIVDHDAHAGERDVDINDPVHRTVAGMLI